MRILQWQKNRQAWRKCKVWYGSVDDAFQDHSDNTSTMRICLPLKELNFNWKSSNGKEWYTNFGTLDARYVAESWTSIYVGIVFGIFMLEWLVMQHLPILRIIRELEWWWRLSESGEDCTRIAGMHPSLLLMDAVFTLYALHTFTRTQNIENGKRSTPSMFKKY